MPAVVGPVDSREAAIRDDMNTIANTRVLTDPSLENTTNRLANELDLHPAAGISISRTRCLRRCLRTDLGDDTEQILIALGNADEAGHLSDAVSPALDNG